MLKDILSITGKPGLYELVSQTKNGLIVESLIDKKRFPAFSSSKISALEDIVIFSENEDIPLVDIFRAISDKENGGKCISHKEPNDALKNYFENVVPEYDRERVYVSDIKKVFAWYNILQGLNMLDFKDEKKENTEDKAENTDKKEEVKKVKATKHVQKKNATVQKKGTTAAKKVQTNTVKTKNK
ncbi:MAG: hypothetical protein GXO79_07110 [Chlorobi bacterium]|nr:hypothetical protein [Chlorobiota bacterium]